MFSNVKEYFHNRTLRTHSVIIFTYVLWEENIDSSLVRVLVGGTDTKCIQLFADYMNIKILYVECP